MVDSGWKENEDQVKRVIAAYGGHVNAWFLIHYDNDHVDDFNAIFDGNNDITVDNVYVTPLDGDVYMSTLRDWDTPESYKKFMEVSKNMPVTQYREKGNILSDIVMGTCALCAVYNVLCIPMTLMGVKLTTLNIVFAIIGLSLCLVSIARNKLSIIAGWINDFKSSWFSSSMMTTMNL